MRGNFRGWWREGAARGGARQRGEKVKQRKRRGKVKLERVEMNIII